MSVVCRTRVSRFRGAVVGLTAALFISVAPVYTAASAPKKASAALRLVAVVPPSCDLTWTQPLGVGTPSPSASCNGISADLSTTTPAPGSGAPMLVVLRAK